MMRKLVTVLLIVAAACSMLALAPTSSTAYNEIEECLDQGHGLMFCVWDALSCHILHECTVDGDPL